MKLTSEEARNLLEKDRNNVKDDRWIERLKVNSWGGKL